MFKSRNEEERNQELRELFAQRWEKSSQHIDSTEVKAPFLIARDGAVINVWIEDDPFHMFLEITIGGWLFEKEVVDQEEIRSFLTECKVD